MESWIQNVTKKIPKRPRFIAYRPPWHRRRAVRFVSESNTALLALRHKSNPQQFPAIGGSERSSRGIGRSSQSDIEYEVLWLASMSVLLYHESRHPHWNSVLFDASRSNLWEQSHSARDRCFSTQQLLNPSTATCKKLRDETRSVNLQENQEDLKWQRAGSLVLD